MPPSSVMNTGSEERAAGVVLEQAANMLRESRVAAQHFAEVLLFIAVKLTQNAQYRFPFLCFLSG